MEFARHLDNNCFAWYIDLCTAIKPSSVVFRLVGQNAMITRPQPKPPYTSSIHSISLSNRSGLELQRANNIRECEKQNPETKCTQILLLALQLHQVTNYLCTCTPKSQDRTGIRIYFWIKPARESCVPHQNNNIMCRVDATDWISLSILLCSSRGAPR